MALKQGKDYWRVQDDPSVMGTFAFALRDALETKGIVDLNEIVTAGESLHLGYDRLYRAYNGTLIPEFHTIEVLGNRIGVKFIWIAGMGWDWANGDAETDTPVHSVTERQKELVGEALDPYAPSMMKNNGDIVPTGTI